MYIIEKAGNFIKGICHPRGDIQKIVDAGIEWVRVDAPFPFEGEWGKENTAYGLFKSRCLSLQGFGLKIMGITPYPRAYEKLGISTVTRDGLSLVEEICLFLSEDMKNIISGWQVTNEMNVPHFRPPLTMKQTPAFILAGLKGIHRGCPQLLNGYNFAGINDDAKFIMTSLSEFGDLYDYVGVDSYYGTWGNGEPDDYIRDIDSAYELTKKPIIMQEFGFSSKGGYLSDEKILKAIQERGFSDMKDVLENIEAFIDSLPPKIASVVRSGKPEERKKDIYGIFPHLLKCWPGKSEQFEHTPEGQAAFYSNLLPKLKKHPQLAGALIYCWQDDERCFYCGEADCPCETGWGLIEANGRLKPSYETVNKEFNN